MEYSKLEELALEIADLYDSLNKKDGHKTWGEREYLDGLMGDIGALQKLMMAKRGYRRFDGDVDEKIEHELADCLWSIMVIAKNLDIDLESKFVENMAALKAKVESKLAE